ncbi:MAG: DUF3299 domain-containing protein [Cyanobacteria bacterium P01_C01_bin.121]
MSRVAVLRLHQFSLRISRLSALIMGFVLAVLIAMVPAAPATAQSAITWDDLQAHSTHLSNPYEHLSEEQTYRLSSLYKMRDWAKVNSPAPDSIEAEEIEWLEQYFIEEGLDVDALLVHADDARTYWQSRSQTTNADLESQSVQLSGYVLPLGDSPKERPGHRPADSQARRVNEFLLVPYVGACIHVPPPPPNQMVYVKPETAIENPGLFSAVNITGTLRSHSGSYDLFRVDGTQAVTVSYAIDLEAIAPAPEHASSQIPSQITGPWWRTLPARVSSVLTVSLATLSNQTSPRTLLVAMLLSFSYGVLHTLGPGHGKAVIASYFVGNGGSMRRGILMGVRIAVFHVLSAVVIVVFTDRLVQQVGGSSASSYRAVQLISYSAISLIGIWMLRQALRGRNALHVASNPLSGNSLSGDAFSGNSVATAEALLYPSLSQQLSSFETTSAQNDFSLAACSCLACEDRQGIGGWLSLAVGAVPCSGALLVLLYGLANDLLWPSVAMVVAISVGMAFTLAWIGALAILGNRYGQRAAARRWRRSLDKTRTLSQFSLVRGAQIVGAGCVSLLGTGLFLLTLTVS